MKSIKVIELRETQGGQYEQFNSDDTSDVVIEDTPFNHPNSHTTNSSTVASKQVSGREIRTHGANASATGNEIPNENIHIVAIESLKPNPRNIAIYGDEAVDEDLQKSLTEHGFQEPLIVTDDFMVLAGHRRLKAARAAGIAQVPVIIRSFKNETDRLITLLESNRQRKKTNEMLGREAVIIMQIEKQLGKERQAQGGKTKSASADPLTTQAKNGSSRDKAGKHIGKSGVTTQHLVATVEAIDKLTADEETDAANAVRDMLNKSISAGYKEAEKAGAVTKKKVKAKKPLDTPTKAPAAPPVASAKAAKVTQTSAYSDVAEAGEIEDHDDAMKVMNQIIAYVQDVLTGADIKLGQVKEWQETMEALTDELRQVGILEA
jgi:ParB/RepB/Spo0J family partition protein